MNVKGVLLYGAEIRNATLTTTKRIQTFVNNCLRRILGVWWPETISTEHMLVKQEIQQRRWRWIGRTLRKLVDSIT